MSNPNLTIRTFRYPQDYPAVRALWEHSGPGIQLGRSDEPQEIVKKLQRDPELFLVAEVDDLIVGVVVGGFDGRRGIVYHLAVNQAYRSRGIAAALMETLEERLRAKGCLRSYLLVTKDNAAGMRFYESHGWRRMELFAYGKDLD